VTYDEKFLREHNAHHLWQPMAHPRQVEGAPPTIIVRGEGVHVWDLDGNRLVDGMGGLWNVNVGYGRREIRDAIVAQLDELPFYSSFRGTTHPRAIELSERLVREAATEGMVRVMFGSNGSDAVEMALRVARQYWRLMGKAERHKFISLKYGYHGTHFGGASISGNTGVRGYYGPLLSGCFQIDAPFPYRNPFTDDPAKLGRACAEALDREIRFQDPGTVAAFVVEPVLGSGGVIVPPDDWLTLAREVCDRHGVLLVADEIITGFGRAGHLFGCRGYGVKPDLMCLAKGISSGYVPLAATLVNQRIADAFLASSGPEGTLYSGYTYSAHPVACAAALAAIDIVHREDLPANAARQGEHLLSRLSTFAQRFECVGDVRGKGLMTCVELVADRATKAAFPRGAGFPEKVAEAAYRRGAIVRVSGGNLIVSPPLVIQRPEVDAIADALEGALQEVSAGRPQRG
jgi:adenosylmethionine-8-amino-7-oxononanoate aminotransferase